MKKKARRTTTRIEKGERGAKRKRKRKPHLRTHKAFPDLSLKRRNTL
jgi:hypothetical protein